MKYDRFDIDRDIVNTTVAAPISNQRVLEALWQHAANTKWARDPGANDLSHSTEFCLCKAVALDTCLPEPKQKKMVRKIMRRKNIMSDMFPLKLLLNTVAVSVCLTAPVSAIDLSDATIVRHSSSAVVAKASVMLQEELSERSGITLRIADQAPKDGVVIRLGTVADLPGVDVPNQAEAYGIEVSGNRGPRRIRRTRHTLCRRTSDSTGDIQARHIDLEPHTTHCDGPGRSNSRTSTGLSEYSQYL